MGTPENRVEQHLRRRVELAGGLCLKFTSSRSGVPDRIVILDGHVIFVELKAPGGKTRPLQDVRISELRAAGARVDVLSSRTEVDAFMAGF
jgi:hypothetical protein